MEVKGWGREGTQRRVIIKRKKKWNIFFFWIMCITQKRCLLFHLVTEFKTFVLFHDHFQIKHRTRSFVCHTSLLANN